MTVAATAFMEFVAVVKVVLRVVVRLVTNWFMLVVAEEVREEMGEKASLFSL